uniref:Uncharacterized protein n=1 Tax=Picea glauca TaxID=3330 RepID=A0A101LTW7_PICGL|nr:hypothetical protein ABT39_MTgene3512 [Picea glauca]
MFRAPCDIDFQIGETPNLLHSYNWQTSSYYGLEHASHTTPFSCSPLHHIEYTELHDQIIPDGLEC